MTKIESKHGIVSRQPYELYMSFTDLRNFVQLLPPDKRESVQADFDTLTATLQGQSFGLKVFNRVPYSRLEYVDYGAPFAFHASLFCDPVPSDPYKTDFHLLVEADLNFMMKMMLGNKLQDALNKVVDGLVDVSNGKFPEGFDPSQYGIHV